MADDRSTEDITEDERVNRLVHRLGELAHQGARIEQRTRFGAIVLLKGARAAIMPNLTMVTAGLILFGLTMEPLFALAAILAAFGWHKKMLEAANPRRLWIRVDELGRIRESELEPA